MRSQQSNSVHLVAHGLRPVLIGLAFGVVVASVPVLAQDTWQVDPQHSIARLSLGSGSNAVEVGLARVSGDVVFDSNDPADPSVNLKITPDDGPVAQYEQMRFTSEQSTLTSDGKLVVAGELSVTRIERSVTMEPNEAYAGPVYGDRVARTDTRQITLVFSDSPQSAAHVGTIQLSGKTSVSREAFPQLLDALTLDDWPTQLVNDEKCEVPSTVGEDYSGTKCTETVIATVTNSVVMVGTAGGEDYSGFQPAVTPDRDRGSIGLDLKLKQELSTPPTAASAK
jgi:polyisoprenoid-binding protein YceI